MAMISATNINSKIVMVIPLILTDFFAALLILDLSSVSCSDFTLPPFGISPSSLWIQWL
jgi:hypothetical protein